MNFVFLDKRSRPFYCIEWEGELWLFYWHRLRKWVSLKSVTPKEASLFPHNLTKSEQEMYHRLHAKWEATGARAG